MKLHRWTTNGPTQYKFDFQGQRSKVKVTEVKNKVILPLARVLRGEAGQDLAQDLIAYFHILSTPTEGVGSGRLALVKVSNVYFICVFIR